MLRAVGPVPIARERLQFFTFLLMIPTFPAQQILNAILLLDNHAYNCSLFSKKMQIPTEKRLHWSVDSPRIL